MGSGSYSLTVGGSWDGSWSPGTLKWGLTHKWYLHPYPDCSIWYSIPVYRWNTWLYFANVDIPNDAEITSAYISFSCNQSTEDECHEGEGSSWYAANYSIRADRSGDATIPTSEGTLPNNQTSIEYWSPSIWVSGNTYNTGSLADIVEEAVGTFAWESGNAMLFTIKEAGSGAYGQMRYAGSATLHVTWVDSISSSSSSSSRYSSSSRSSSSSSSSSRSSSSSSRSSSSTSSSSSSRSFTPPVWWKKSGVIDSTSTFSVTQLWRQNVTMGNYGKNAVLSDSTSLFSTIQLWRQNSTFSTKKSALVKSVVKGHPERKY